MSRLYSAELRDQSNENRPKFNPTGTMGAKRVTVIR